jgi:hypothetical protein
MLVTPLPIIALVRLSQNENAESPTVMTLSGMVTLVILVQPKKAPHPMHVTVLPRILDGMTTAPPDPVYPVMVIVFVSGEFVV